MNHRYDRRQELRRLPPRTRAEEQGLWHRRQGHLPPQGTRDQPQRSEDPGIPGREKEGPARMHLLHRIRYGLLPVRSVLPDTLLVGAAGRGGPHLRLLRTHPIHGDRPGLRSLRGVFHRHRSDAAEHLHQRYVPRDVQPHPRIRFRVCGRAERRRTGKRGLQPPFDGLEVRIVLGFSWKRELPRSCRTASRSASSRRTPRWKGAVR